MRRRLRLTNQRIVPLFVLPIPVDEPRDSLANIGRRFVAQERVRLPDVRVGVLCVSLVAFSIPEFEFERELIADHFGERLDIDGIRATNVENLAVRGAGVEELLVYPEDVLDVGEIPRLGAVAVNYGGFAVQASRDEVRDRHVRAHPGTVDGEVSKGYRGKAVDLVVDAGVLLGRELRDAIRADRRCRVILVVGQVLGFAVDRRGACDDDPFGIARSGGFEHVDRPVDVDLVYVPRVLDARPDPGLGGLMVDVLRLAHEIGDEFGIAEIAVDEFVAPLALVCDRTAGFDGVVFDSQTVERLEAIEDDDIVALFDESLGDMPADETRTARDENSHCPYPHDVLSKACRDSYAPENLYYLY